MTCFFSCLFVGYCRRGGKAFIDDLLPRLNPKSMIGGGVVMPFELEVGFYLFIQVLVSSFYKNLELFKFLGC